MLKFFLFFFRNILISIMMILAPFFFFFFREILIYFKCFYFKFFFVFLMILIYHFHIYKKRFITIFLLIFKYRQKNFKNCVKLLEFVLNTIILFSNYSWIVFIVFSKSFREYNKTTENPSYKITWNYSKRCLICFKCKVC